MVTAVFSTRDGRPCGFYVAGHSGWAAAGQDIVCSAVSSAVLLAANTLADELPAGSARCEDGTFALYAPNAPLAAPVLGGLLAHLRAIAKQYPHHVRVMLLNRNGGNTNV